MFKFRKAFNDALLRFIFILFSTTLIVFALSPMSHIYTLTWQRHATILTTLFWVLFLSSLSTVWQKIKAQERFVLVFLFLFFNIFSMFRVLENDSNWYSNHQTKSVTDYLLVNAKKEDLILVPEIGFDMLFNYYYEGDTRVTTILNGNLNKYYLTPKSSWLYTEVLETDSIKQKYNESLNEISSKYKKIWFTFEGRPQEKYVMNYFESKSDWEVKVADDLANNILWMAEKK